MKFHETNGDGVFETNGDGVFGSCVIRCDYKFERAIGDSKKTAKHRPHWRIYL